MDESHGTPFDDYPERSPDEQRPQCKVRGRRMLRVLRAVSAVSFGLAIASACAILALDCIHFLGPALMPWRLKSAFPLIFTGISYGCLQFTLPRSWKEFLLGMAVAAAFMLWGAEQFLPDPALASLIDDVVVFLFVLDLSIVIGGYLKQKRP